MTRSVRNEKNYKQPQSSCRFSVEYNFTHCSTEHQRQERIEPAESQTCCTTGRQAVKGFSRQPWAFLLVQLCTLLEFFLGDLFSYLALRSLHHSSGAFLASCVLVVGTVFDFSFSQFSVYCSPRPRVSATKNARRGKTKKKIQAAHQFHIRSLRLFGVHRELDTQEPGDYERSDE